VWQQAERPIRYIGRYLLTLLQESGALFILFIRITRHMTSLLRDRQLLLDQMLLVGVNSLPLVAVIAVFTGAVSAWQTAYQFEGFISYSYIGAATSLAIFIELGPVLTAIVLAGRVGSSIAAELGTMRVTEQIDALETLAIDPVRFLAQPRFVAATAMMPILTIFANFIALMGAFLVSNVLIGISAHVFFDGVQQQFDLRNVFGGLCKSVVFGANTALVGCYVGFHTRGGAQGVGRATIQAFVVSASLILVWDYILATIIF